MNCSLCIHELDEAVIVAADSLKKLEECRKLIDQAKLVEAYDLAGEIEDSISFLSDELTRLRLTVKPLHE